MIGVVLPGLPTVPFLLLTAWFSSKRSKRLHRWLCSQPHFGQLLIDWETQGAVSRKSKVVAILLLTLSWLMVFRRIDNLWFIGVLTLVLVSVLDFRISRPEPR